MMTRRNNTISDAQMGAMARARMVKTAVSLSIPVHRGLWDIFTDTGWKVHSRYRLIKGAWVYISGLRLPYGFKFPA